MDRKIGGQPSDELTNSNVLHDHRVDPRGYHRPLGEWNFQEVTVKGSTIKVELNGTVILDTDLSKVDLSTVMANKPHPGKDRTNGFFGFAGHNDPVAFKDVAIKKL